MPPLFIEGITARDSSYNCIRDYGDRTYLRDARIFAESLWPRYERHADRNFLTEIQNDFQSRFWEMYLACSLEEVGYTIECRKPGPDVLLTMGETRVWIEAVAPSRGEDGHPDAVPGYRLGQGSDVPDREILLRYRSAILDKFRKFEEYREKGIVLPGDACVVALNGSKISYACMEGLVPRIVQAVYPLGHPQITFGRESGKVLDRSFTYRPELSKTNAGSVSTEIFLQDEHRPLSAVLFSCINAVDHHCRFGDDYVMVHNRRATTAILQGLVGRGKEYSVSGPDDALILDVHDWDEPLRKEVR
jgi:hypothetical protein